MTFACLVTETDALLYHAEAHVVSIHWPSTQLDRGQKNYFEIRLASRMFCHFLWFLVTVTVKASEIRKTVSAADLIIEISECVGFF